MTEKNESKKPHDLRDDLSGREDLATENREDVLPRDKSRNRSDPDIVRPSPDNSTVPDGQTTKGGA